MQKQSQNAVEESVVLPAEMAPSNALPSAGEEIPLMVELVFSLFDQINSRIHPSQLMWLMSLMMIQAIRLVWASQIKRTLSTLEGLN